MLIICIACHSPLHGIDQWVCAPCKAAAPKRTPEETRALLTTALYDIRALEAWLIAEDYNAPRLIDLVAERARRKAGQP